MWCCGGASEARGEILWLGKQKSPSCETRAFPRQKYYLHFTLNTREITHLIEDVLETFFGLGHDLLLHLFSSLL